MYVAFAETLAMYHKRIPMFLVSLTDSCNVVDGKDSKLF